VSFDSTPVRSSTLPVPLRTASRLRVLTAAWRGSMVIEGAMVFVLR